MGKSLRLRILRKFCATLFLLVVLFLLRPSSASANNFHFEFDAWCGFSCDGLWYCMDICDTQSFGCWYQCQQYDEPSRGDCQDACTDAEMACVDWCWSHCSWCG